jgi:hypothetical protein
MENWPAISLSGSDRVGRLQSAKKSNGRRSWTAKRAAQLLGKDVGVRAIGRRRESYSVSARFLTLEQCSAAYLSEILSIKLYDGTVTGAV